MYLNTTEKYGLDYGLSAVAAPIKPVFKNSGQNPAAVEKNSAERIEQPAPKAQNYTAPESSRNEEKKDDVNYKAMMYLGLYFQNQADENDSVSARGITNFVSALEAVGVNVDPIKKAIETVTGKSYAEFASSDPETRISGSDFSSYGPFASRLPVMSNAGFDSARAIAISRSDNAGGGYCARGTKNILDAMGMRVEGANATHWDTNLSRSRNWVRLSGINAANAPEGAVLVFNNNEEAGRGRLNNGRGAQYGHVEVVAEGAHGERLFISDAARRNAGGSVPQNFAGAFLYVGPNAPQSNLEIAARINHQGQQMVASHHAPSPGMPG